MDTSGGNFYYDYFGTDSSFASFESIRDSSSSSSERMSRSSMSTESEADQSEHGAAKEDSKEAFHHETVVQDSLMEFISEYFKGKVSKYPTH